MVKITNGANVFEVTIGAFNTIYSRQGYRIVNAAKKEKVEAGSNKALKGDEESFDESEKFCAELIEKPVSQWNKDEVKKFAELKQIDIAGTKNVNEAKSRIVAFLAQ